MTFQRIQALCLFVLALLQLLSAAVLLNWALPLFVDPPLLGNGIDSASQQLTTLIQNSPQEFKRLGWMPEHFRWLWVRHTEGVFFALAAAAALLGSSVITALFVCLQLGKLNAGRKKAS